MSRFFLVMSKITVPILLYHGVHECGADAIRDPLYSLRDASIAAQLRWLRAHGYVAISLEKLLSTQQPSEKAFLITVDDGLESAYTHIFPKLQNAGYRAVFFPVTGKIGCRGWVGWRELDKMRREGMEIGSHSVTHADLTTLTRKELMVELVESRKRIEDKLGIAVRFLSLPGGYANRSVNKAAAEAGYGAICCSVVGYNGFPVEPYRLKRFCLRGRDDETILRRIMGRDVLPLLPRYVRGNGAPLCRALLGSRLYAALRNLVIPPGAHSVLPRFPSS